MKINQVTVNAIGEVAIKGIELHSMAMANIARHLCLDVDKMSPMDDIKKTFVHGLPVITVTLAQDKPWTYITHVFSMAADVKV